jgi:hypothetical protein
MKFMKKLNVPVTRRGNIGEVRLMDLEPTERSGILRDFMEAEKNIRYVKNVRHPQHNQTGSNSSTIAADSSNGVTNTRCCRYSCMLS